VDVATYSPFEIKRSKNAKDSHTGCAHMPTNLSHNLFEWEMEACQCEFHHSLSP